MKKETYEFTDEQITKMNYYDRRAALIAELNKNLVKNRETDDYDYIDLKGINDVLHPLKCKYKITDMPCKEDNGDMSLIMIDSLTGDEHGKITIPWPGNDDEHNNNIRKIQITGANITYLRRYLLMLAYDISAPKDFYDENKTPLKFNDIPEALRPKESVKDGQEENKKSSDLDPVSKEKYFGTEKKDLVPYETGEEELQLDPNRGRGKTKNIYDDAENYMVKEGKYEGIMLCDVAKMDPNDLIEMARQGSLIEPELQRHAETLVKKYNL